MTRYAIIVASCAAIAACSPNDDVSEDAAGKEAAPPTQSASIPQPQPQPVVDPDSEEEKAVAKGSTHVTIPARFHGKWAENVEACAIRGHQQYRIGASEVGFFESTGIVQTVRVDGDYAAATLSEQYGDSPPAVYVFYMAREGDDAMRLRYDKNDGFRVVRCPDE